MFSFQYEIELDEETGRPYIKPVGSTEDEMSFVEHKFMAIELTRSIITQSIISHESNPKKYPLPLDEYERLLFLEKDIVRIAEIFSVTIKEQFELLNIADRLMNKDFDITVLTIEERDALNYNGIIFNEKIYKREEGLKVKITSTGQVFKLEGGIDNEHWKEI